LENPGASDKTATDYEQEIDELVQDWIPEPLAAPLTTLEELEAERQPVIVGYVSET